MNIHVATPPRALLRDDPAQDFARDVIDGLSQPQKMLSPKYFYDAAGSELFEQITVLPEYYPTRTELGILRSHARDVCALVPDGAALIEFGAGATTKVRLLLDDCRFSAYVPVDISGNFLHAQAAQLRRDFPRLTVLPVAADFTRPFVLPDEVAEMPKLGFFPGSTLGNFDPADAVDFLSLARQVLGAGAQMLIGVDLEKSEGVLVPAYDDAAGVTARFNRNVLVRINRELGGNFDLSAFGHRAIYNRAQHRIEMHLVSLNAQTVRLAGRSFALAEGEHIHTESSYKYSIARFSALARAAGWTVQASWTDKDRTDKDRTGKNRMDAATPAAEPMFSVHVISA